jgi:CHAD domain-containing protein
MGVVMRRDGPAPELPAAAPGAGGPRSESARIADDLAARTRAVARAAARVDSDDAGTAVHDLRVALRRLNAALRLWDDVLIPKPARGARRRIRRMRRELGPLRELEADAQHLTKHLPELPIASRVAAEALLDDLMRRSGKARRRLRSAVGRKAARAIARRVTRATTGIDERIARHHDPGTPARNHIAETRGVALRRLGAGIAAGADDRLHEARVALKKWRYALEAAARPDGSAPSLKTLRALQEALGHAHDCAMLHGRVERRARRLGEHGLSAEAAALIPLLERIVVEREWYVGQVRGLAPRVAALATDD